MRDSFIIPFWVPFWNPKAVLEGPSWHQEVPKEARRSIKATEEVISKNTKNILFLSTVGCLEVSSGASWAAFGTCAQEASKNGIRKGTPNWTKQRAQNGTPQCVKSRLKSVFFLDLFLRPLLDFLGEPEDRPKRAPREPNRGPRKPQEEPKRAQERLKESQECP